MKGVQFYVAGIHITVYHNWEQAWIYTCEPLGKQTIWDKHWSYITWE